MSTIKTTTLSTQGGSTVPVDTVVNGTAKAWVNFNGTGTVAIRRAFNVSSITDNATGNYTVNFTTAMPNTNYAAHTTSSITGNWQWASTNNFQTTSLELQSITNSGGTGADSTTISVTVFS
jgi:hypothetical protein